MLELFQLWALVEILGLVCLPLTFSVFRNLPDRGWAFSKALGMVLLAFCVWLPLMCVPALYFNQLFVASIMLMLLAVSWFGFMRLYHTIVKMVRQNGLYILVVEILFLGMVFLLGWIRSFGPGILGFEMFMDVGFVAAIMRSPHLPPNDMWFAGYSINYYYYAHYTIAVLAKLLGQSPSIIFNTGICIFFGLSAVNLFGVTCNVVTWARYLRLQGQQYPRILPEQSNIVLPPLLPAIPYGLLSILMALIFGNLASTQQWWLTHDSPVNLFNLWFGITRVVENTINEFPAFSFLLSCFHAHVLTLAFTIMAIGLAFNLLLESGGRGIYIFGRGWSIPLNLGCTALVLGGLFVMNGWDYPTYVGLMLVCIIGQQWFAYHKRFSFSLLLGILIAGASLVGLSVIFYLPFYLGFISPAQGIGLVSAQLRSILSQELLIFGLFTFIFLSLILASTMKQPLFRQLQKDTLVDNNKASSMSLPTQENLLTEKLLAGGEGPVEETMPDDDEASAAISSTGEKRPVTPRGFPSRFIALAYLLPWVLCLFILKFVPNSVTFVVSSNFAILGVVLMCYHFWDRSHAFILLLGAAAFALIAGCEIFYLRDAFADGHQERMNTVFKFYFQAWILFSVACSAGLFFILDSFRSVLVTTNSSFLRPVLRGIRLLWSLFLLILILASMVYPLTAPYQRYASAGGKFSPTYLGFTNRAGWLGDLKNLERTNSLDGLEYLKDCLPSRCSYASSAADYAAIRWLNTNVQGDPVIVEAVKDDYSFFGRISAFTGLPTLMNWPGHEYQWRLTWLKNSAHDAEYKRRVPDIDQIYTNPNPNTVLSLMARYKAQYLYVGPLEIEKYLHVDLDRYAKFMQIVYENERVTIYRVR